MTRPFERIGVVPCSHTRLVGGSRTSAVGLRHDIEVRQDPGAWKPTFGAGRLDFRRCSPPRAQGYGGGVSWSRWSWAASATPTAASDDLALPDLTRRHAGRERAVDALAFVLAVSLGALFLSPELHDNPDPWSTSPDRRRRRGRRAGLRLAVVAASMARRLSLSCACCWGRSRAPRPRPDFWRCPPWPYIAPRVRTMVVSLLWVPSLLAYAVYSPTTGPVSVVLFVMPLVLAAERLGHVHQGPPTAAAVLARASPASRG